MRVRVLAVALGLGAVVISAAWGQALPRSAKVDAEPLDLTEPDRYQVPTVLEPVRRVTLVATTDGVVRSQDAKAGAAVREGQEVAQFDRAEAAARLKIARAEVKEQQAALDSAKAASKAAAGKPADAAIAEARLEAAQGRAELAQIGFDRCSLRAPFSGRVLLSPVSDGQFVTKGSTIAELADVSSLRALIPVARPGSAVGGAVTVSIDGQPVAGKIQALLPLPESFAILRELSAPLAAAWVVVPNPDGGLEPGQRVVSPAVPNTPTAVVPAHALRKPDEKAKGGSGSPTVQVIRNEYVVNVPVRVLGSPGPERVQVTGPLRATDALIVSSSVPLIAGTLVRFNPGSGAVGAVEGTSPNPAESGTTADLSPPAASRGRAAPIGAPGSAVPRSRAGGRPAGTPPPPSSEEPKPAAKKNSVPF